MEAKLYSEVSLKVYKYPTDRASQDIEFTLQNTGEDVNVRVVLTAEGSDIVIEAFQNVYTPDQDRQQHITIDLPDYRTYQCVVYQNNEAGEPFTVGNGSDEE